MKFKKRFNFAGMLLAAAFCTVPTVKSQTVAWGTSISFNPIAFNANGSVDNEQNIWTLGWFNDGFIPDQTNFLQWADNYNIVSSLVPEEVPPGSGDLGNYPQHKENFTIDEETGDPISLWSVSVNTYDVGGEAAGKQAYIFAYNDLGLIGTPQGQALLIREDGLLLPSVPNQVTFDIANNPLDTNDDAFTVIWGRVDRDTVNLGGVLTGGGIMQSPLNNGAGIDSATGDGNGGFDTLFSTFEAQLATWPTPIPEPSSALLAICGASLALLRRRRNA